MHRPVLLEEVDDLFRPVSGARFVDATIGLGGHTRRLLETHGEASLLGIDMDPEALALCQRDLKGVGERLHFREGNFTRLTEYLRELGWPDVWGILADLGQSSMQLDRGDRGFSFAHDGPLDMRMGRQDVTAAAIINSRELSELTDLFRLYGEERMAYKIARAIVGKRPLSTTRELRELIHRIKGPREGKKDSATRVFQALRIAVNDELRNVEHFIPDAIRVLAPGGRLAVISFHSLEDRIVKRLFRHFSGRCICPPGVPGCTCGPVHAVKILTRRPVTPTPEEVDDNPRSRSARMRAVEKL